MVTTQDKEETLSQYPSSNILSIDAKSEYMSVSSLSGIDSESVQAKPDTKVIVHEVKSTLLFKVYVLASMMIVWSAYTIIIKSASTGVPKEEKFFSSVIPLFSELCKLVISFFMLFYENNMNIRTFGRTVNLQIFKKPKDFFKMSPVAICYVIQNNLDIVAIYNLPASVFQVTSQLKIVSTALFMWILLGKKLSIPKWVFIFICFSGIATVQVGNLNNTSSGSGEENAVIGLISILIICIVAGFAGVYFEKMLKDGTQGSIWIRNIQLYVWGVPAAIITMLMKENSQIIEKGIFHGFNYKVLVAILLVSIGGIYISLIMKYLDNIQKSFAAAATIIVVTIISLFIFDGVTISITFALGSIIVIGAIIGYNKVK